MCIVPARSKGKVTGVSQSRTEGVDSEDPLDELFRVHYRNLVALARLMVGSLGRAEELVQDSFVGMMRRVAATGLPDNPGGYLRTSVVNGCRAEFRRRDMQRRLDPVIGRDGVAPAAPEPSDLVDAVMALPLRQRQAVALRYFADLSEAQVASALGVRPGTVKTLLHRGVAKLRQDMAND